MCLYNIAQVGEKAALKKLAGPSGPIADLSVGRSEAVKAFGSMRRPTDLQATVFVESFSLRTHPNAWYIGFYEALASVTIIATTQSIPTELLNLYPISI